MFEGLGNKFMSLLGLRQGDMGLKEASNILRDYKLDRAERNQYGGLNISPVDTMYGTAYTDAQLNDYVTQMQEVEKRNRQMEGRPQERVLPQELGVGMGEPSAVEGQVQGVADQYQAPQGPQDAQGIPGSILDYATGYRYSPAGDYGQSRLNENTLGILWNEINATYPDLDQQSKETLLANLVAVAQAESGMGGAYGNPDAGTYKNSNYWNWFKGGNRGYDPEDFGVMADDIVSGIGGYTLGTGGRFTRDNASTYTGNDNLSFWYDDIYNPAMNAMGY